MATEVKEKKTVEIPAAITVRELAERLGISPVGLLKALINNGIMVSITERVDFETAAIVAEDLGFQLVPEGSRERAAPATAVADVAPAADASGDDGIPWYLAGEPTPTLRTRPPVVAILGHVDHGKTTLLDAIRHTKVAAGESGGITQHIGAYQVERQGQQITFIDTPGHEAFTAMRARGAQATDIAIIVVAADDGVMPQTREAIDHARAAGVPIIAAITKVDRPDAKPDRALEQLAGLDLVPDTWGGDTFCIKVSGVSGEGIDELLDSILLVAEDKPPLANPARPALGTVLEGRVDQQRGIVADLLVQSGTLKSGDYLVIDTSFGRVRAMFDQSGKRANTALPSTPVEILGLPTVPDAGARFRVVESDRVAKQLVAERVDTGRADRAADVAKPMSFDELFQRAAGERPKVLNLIVKTDVQGTLEPVVAELERLSGTVKVDVLRAATGDVTEADVNLAAASNAVVIAFRVDTDPVARKAAAARVVEIRNYDVIYTLVDDVRDALTGMLDPTYEEKQIGRAEVRQVFSITKQGKIAGCAVISGVARRSATVKVIRGGEVIATSAVASLKRFTEDVREVREGFECGVALAATQDIAEGDILEFVVSERVK